MKYSPLGRGLVHETCVDYYVSSLMAMGFSTSAKQTVAALLALYGFFIMEYLPLCRELFHETCVDYICLPSWRRVFTSAGSPWRRFLHDMCFSHEISSAGQRARSRDLCLLVCFFPHGDFFIPRVQKALGGASCTVCGFSHEIFSAWQRLRA